MSKLWRILFSSKSLTFASICFLLLYGCSLYHRYVYIDDAWFGEQSYWFAKYGFPKTVTIKDFFGWDEHLFVYHKLNIIIGAAIIQLFGWSVYYLKVFTLIMYMLFLKLYRDFFINEHSRLSASHWHFAFIFIFTTPIFLSLSFTFRPEILVMLLGFISYWGLEKYLKKLSKGWLSIAGIAAGLAFLTHLNGIMFCAGGFGLLLYNRKWKGLVHYTLLTAVIGGLYFYDLWQPGHFDQFLSQMTSWPDNIGTSYNAHGLSAKLHLLLTKLLSEHKRFFWSDRVLSASLIFLISLLYIFKNVWNNHKNLILYLLIITVALNVFGSQIAERYLIYSFPYFGIIVSVAMIRVVEEGSGLIKGLFALLFIFQFAVGGKMLFEIYSKNNPAATTSSIALSPIKDSNARILVPYEYIFNELGFRDLVSYKGFEYHQTVFGPFTQLSFFERASQLKIDYIVLNEDVLLQRDKSFPFFKGGSIDENQFYSLYDSTPEGIILKKKW
ncbi:MAG TPA: glycosyltransferase family 39 protein [Bacteroidia bacterium]|nr:glycosyltransferase family 39 protein [Bacteroidia bacterium]